MNQTPRQFRFLFVLLSLTLLGTGLTPGIAFAGKVKSMTLADIIDVCGIAFRGKCVNVKSGKDPLTGSLATWYTFRVHTPLVGEMGETVVIKQYGGSSAELATPIPAATYAKGDQVILFAYKPARSGFSSAVGLQQGKFHIRQNKESGTRLVSNGTPIPLLIEPGTRFLTPYLASGSPADRTSLARATFMNEEEFLQRVRELVEERRPDHAPE